MGGCEKGDMGLIFFFFDIGVFSASLRTVEGGSSFLELKLLIVV